MLVSVSGGIRQTVSWPLFTHHAWRPVDPQTAFFDAFETPEQTPCEDSEGG